ncbi:MAG: hypothetical protein ACLRNN_02635 [Streptococcus salivarius]|uniref:Uncharacterized protein n=1 Tax=Streptococcus salivarius TaxID=1304 RepID=A0A6N3CNY8_STRSL
MDYKRIWKKYTLISRITTVLLIILLFFLRWLFLENSTIQLIALVSVVGLVLILKNYLNSLLVGETQKILKGTMGLDFWYDSIQRYGKSRRKKNQINARIASITYAYMIGDFPSVISQAEELQFAGIRKPYLDFLWFISLKASLLSGKIISKDDLLKSLHYLNFKDEKAKEVEQREFLAMYDILVERKPNDFFNQATAPQAFERLELQYFKALNELIKGNKTQSQNLFEEIAQEDERLYFVRMARQWLGNKGEGVTKNLEQGLEKIEPLTVDLPSLELETPKKNKKKWLWLLLIIPALMLLGIIQTTIDEKKSDDGIYYLIVKNQSTKTATIDKRFWIKIDGEQITLKDVEGEHTYHFDSQNDEFTKDSEIYSCMLHDGTLLLVNDGIENEQAEYVSPESSWYSGYEQGKVKIEK